MMVRVYDRESGFEDGLVFHITPDPAVARKIMAADPVLQL